MGSVPTSRPAYGPGSSAPPQTGGIPAQQQYYGQPTQSQPVYPASGGSNVPPTQSGGGGQFYRGPPAPGSQVAGMPQQQQRVGNVTGGSAGSYPGALADGFNNMRLQVNFYGFVA